MAKNRVRGRPGTKSGVVAESTSPSGGCSRCLALMGAAFGALTLLFFMFLVIGAISGRDVPPGARFLVIVVLALGAATFTGMGGCSAAIRGKIPLPFARQYPVAFSAAGGTAVFLIGLVVGNWLYVTPTWQVTHVVVPVPSDLPLEFTIKNLSAEAIADVGEVRTINGDRLLYVEFRQGADAGNLSFSYPNIIDKRIETLRFRVHREGTIAKTAG